MKKTQKRAFILSECKSPYIQQAIFILKDGYDSENKGVIADAERIVASYMGNKPSIEKKQKGIGYLLPTILAGIGIFAVSILFLIR